MRSYIRHPSDIPIDILPAEVDTGDTSQLNDVSHGGLSFNSSTRHELGAIVRLRIPLVMPAFEALGKVVWCGANGGNFTIGVEFLDNADMFRARMVEQICHIEHYKKTVRDNEGRVLTSQDAALEWIEKYAQGFPSTDDDAPG